MPSIFSSKSLIGKTVNNTINNTETSTKSESNSINTDDNIAYCNDIKTNLESLQRSARKADAIELLKHMLNLKIAEKNNDMNDDPYLPTDTHGLNEETFLNLLVEIDSVIDYASQLFSKAIVKAKLAEAQAALEKQAQLVEALRAELAEELTEETKARENKS